MTPTIEKDVLGTKLTRIGCGLTEKDDPVLRIIFELERLQAENATIREENDNLTEALNEYRKYE